METIKVGLKRNSAFLFKQLGGNVVEACTGGIHHVSVITLNTIQFDVLKRLIEYFGCTVSNSLIKTSAKEKEEMGCDYSCYIKA
jgi:hypothetical protein